MKLQETTVSDIPTFTSWAELKEFFKEHKSELIYLKNHEGKTDLLGVGSYGKAFNVKGTTKVIKVTTSPEEIGNAKALVGKNFKTLAHIYYVQSIKSNLGIIITDLYYKLSSKEKHNIQHKYLHIIWEYFDGRDLWSSLDNITDPKLKQFIIDVKKEYSSILNIDEIDFHEDNVMKTSKGDYILIDL